MLRWITVTLQARQSPATRGLPPPTVLLVEDHADSRELYAIDLRHFGFRVDEAANSSQALRAVAERIPDVVVADLHLPDIDGLNLCRTLKETAPTRNVPIIAITAMASPEMQRAAEDAGCDAVLLKPCIPSELRAKIERVLVTSLQARQRADAVRERALALGRKGAALRMKSERLQTRFAKQIANEAFIHTLARVRAEFVEMPGLHLTIDQAARLLGLDRPTAARSLDRLVAEGFLRKSGTETYLKAV
jgi:CheY-like chemotaxis protein